MAADQALKSADPSPFVTSEAVIRGDSDSDWVRARTDDRPTEPSEFVDLPPTMPRIPRYAAVPQFPEAWLLDDFDGVDIPISSRVEPSFSPAPVVRQSYADMCEPNRRLRSA